MEVAMSININSTSNMQGKLIDLESFSDRLRKEDIKQLHLSKSFYGIYIGLIGFYTIMIILLFVEERGIIKLLSQLFYILSFIAFILIFRKNLKKFQKIDYSVPLVEMLKGVINRYRLRLNYFFIVAIPIILMDVALTLSFYEDLTPMEPINRVLIIQVFYIPIMTISAFIGVLIWRKKQKPLIDKAKEILLEID